MRQRTVTPYILLLIAASEFGMKRGADGDFREIAAAKLGCVGAIGRRGR
jgi:hypothetical protein